MQIQGKSTAIRAGWNAGTRRGRPREGLYRGESRSVIAQLTGIPRPVVSAILNGKRGCSLSTGVVLARALSVPIERLERDLRTARDRREGKNRPQAPSRGREVVIPSLPASAPMGRPLRSAVA